MDAVKLAMSILGGLLIPTGGLIFWIARLASRVDQIEKECLRMMDHLEDRKIHIDPERDERRFQTIERQFSELEKKMDDGMKSLSDKLERILMELSRK